MSAERVIDEVSLTNPPELPLKEMLSEDPYSKFYDDTEEEIDQRLSQLNIQPKTSL